MAQGFTVQSVQERPFVGQGGRAESRVVISIQTDLGASGELSISSKEFEALDDDALFTRIVEKAANLDRPFRL